MKDIIKALEKANMQLTSLGANNTNFCTDAIKLCQKLQELLPNIRSVIKSCGLLQEHFGIINAEMNLNNYEDLLTKIKAWEND